MEQYGLGIIRYQQQQCPMNYVFTPGRKEMCSSSCQVKEKVGIKTLA